MRKSDLLLENLYKDELSENTPKNNRKYLNVAIVLIFALLGAVVALSLMQFTGTTSNSSVEGGKLLTSPHLCGTCHNNPEVGGDYVLCESCGFDSSIDKTLKCPDGYGNMLVVKAKEGFKENAKIAGKVYKHCKDTMEEGASDCDVNVLDLIPDLYDNKFSDRVPSPPHRPPRPLPEPRGFGQGPMDNFDPFMDFPMIFDILPFFDDEIINEPPVGPNGEAVTNELNEHNEEAIAALINAPEIETMADLFDALPATMDENNPEHIKLTKTLMRCMRPGEKYIQKPLCADGSEPLKCRETPEHEACQQKKQEHQDNKAAGIKKKLAPICADGTYAECDTAGGYQGFRKPKKCYPNDGNGKPKKPRCADGSKPQKCAEGSTEVQCVKGKKYFCTGSDKRPKCPEGYSTGPCKDTNTGVRSKAKCPEGSEKIKCKKEENSSSPFCISESGDRIWNTMCDNGEQPSCQGDSEYALLPFLKKVQFSQPGDAEEMMWDSSSEEEEEVFLSSANAKGGRGAHGKGAHGKGGRRPHHRRAHCEDGSRPGCYDDTGARNKDVVVCKDDTVEKGFVSFDPMLKCKKQFRMCSFDQETMVKPTCADGSDIILPKRELTCRDGSAARCPTESVLSCKNGEEPVDSDFSSCDSKPICSDANGSVKPVCDDEEQPFNLAKRGECGRGKFSAACYDFAEDGTATFVKTGTCPKGFEEVKSKSSICKKGEAELRTKICENGEEVLCEDGEAPKRHKKFLYPETEQTEQEGVANLILSRGGPHHHGPGPHHGPQEGPVGGPEALDGPGRPATPPHGRRPPFPPHEHHNRPGPPGGRREHVTIDFMCLKLNLN